MTKSQRRRRKTRYYLAHMLQLLVPRAVYRSCLCGRLGFIDINSDQAAHDRLNYYFKLNAPFSKPENSEAFIDIPFGKKNSYYLDFYKAWKYLDPKLEVAYQFGDVLHIPEVPTLVKSRPICRENARGILMKWNTVRHYYFVPRDIPYRKKRDMMIWRGRAGRCKPRQQFIERWYGHPFTDIGDSSSQCRHQPWHRPFTSIPEQLENKFILSIEGVDVATNLKWIMSSNSLCFMAKPRYETWFMEGRLVPGRHYVCLRDDFSDLDEKIDHYLANPDEAEWIVENQLRWVDQFRDAERERALQVNLLLRYLEFSGQLDLEEQELVQYVW